MEEETPVKFVVKRKPSTDEWVVVAHDSDNRRIEACCYYTNTLVDAEATRVDMQKRSDAVRKLKFHENLNTLIVQRGYTLSSGNMISTFVNENRVKLLELLKGYPC